MSGQQVTETQIAEVFEALMEQAHSTALEKGFYTDYYAVMGALESQQLEEPVAWVDATAQQASIARIHSELSEWLEAVRKGERQDEHCPKFLSQEIEAADVIIRVLDTCAQEGYDLVGALLAKMAYNKSRPYKHGKNS